jgi:periplasmic copper chaperone A
MKFLLLFALILLQGGDKITVKNIWIRPAPETFNTAIYCTIVNNGNKPDTLYKVTSPISDEVQIHETYKKDDMMGMREVKNLVVLPHDSLVFKPGGYHIMVINLKENVVVNNFKEATLFFKQAGEIKINAESRR